jgi:hypothetical protein
MNKSMKGCIKFTLLAGKEIIARTAQSETVKETTEEQ